MSSSTLQVERTPLGAVRRAAASLDQRTRAIQEAWPLQVALALFLHHQLWPQINRAVQLPGAVFSQPFLLEAALERGSLVTLATLALGLIAATHRRTSWTRIDERGITRLFMLIPVGVFAWQFSLYATNVVAGQLHLLDRLLLVALAAACWIHPGFVLAFTLWLGVILSQLNFPMPEAGWHWPDKRLPWDMLVLFCGYTLTRTITRPKPQLFAYLALCLTGATYSHAAIEKLRLGPHLWSWPLENHVSNIFVGAHLQAGWLRGLSEQTMVSIARWLDVVSVPIGITTILVEISGLALLLHRKLTFVVLVGLMGLHATIYATTGIFFWKWIAVDAGLIALVWMIRDDARGVGVFPSLGGWRGVALSVVVMASTRLLFYNVDFAWFDSRLTNYFELRARGQSGADNRLDPRFFAPHDIVFQQSRFYYLVDRKVIAGTYATVRDHELMQRLATAGPDDVPAIRDEFGSNQFDPFRRRVFERVVAASVSRALADGDREHAMHRFGAPYHFQRAAAEDTYAFDEPITSVEVRFIEWLRTDARLVLLTDELVLEIPIED